MVAILLSTCSYMCSNNETQAPVIWSDVVDWKLWFSRLTHQLMMMIFPALDSGGYCWLMFCLFTLPWENHFRWVEIDTLQTKHMSVWLTLRVWSRMCIYALMQKHDIGWKVKVDWLIFVRFMPWHRLLHESVFEYFWICTKLSMCK